MHGDVAVRAVMDREFVVASESDNVLLTGEHIALEETPVALVTADHEDETPVGALTIRHLLTAANDDGPPLYERTVGECMDESVPTVAAGESVERARDRMTARDTDWIAVTDATGPAGVFTDGDLLAGTDFGSDDATSTAERTDRDADEESSESQWTCEYCGSGHDPASFDDRPGCPTCRDL